MSHTDHTPLTLMEVLAEEHAALGGALPPGASLKQTLAAMREQNRIALCLSGGGARSAIFSLGVAEGLARAGVLGKVDYLSTVGGGGWTGGWLTAWAARAGGWKAVTSGLSDVRGEAVERLRHFMAYLNPFAADPAVWGTEALWNMLIQWLLAAPALFAILLVPRIFLEALRLEPGIGLAHTAVVTGALAATAYIWRVSREEDDSGASAERAGARLAVLSGLSALCCCVAWSWYPHTARTAPYWVFLAIALAACVAGRIGGSLRRSFERAQARSWAWTIPGACAASAAVFALSRAFPQPRGAGQLLFASFGPPMFLAAILLSAIFVGALSSSLMWDADRRRWIRLSSEALILILAWAAVNFSTLYFPAIFVGLGWQARTWILAGGGAAAIITLLTGYSATTASEIRDIVTGLASIPFLKLVPQLLTPVVLTLAPPLSAVWVLLLASLASAQVADHVTSILPGPRWATLLLCGAALAVAATVFGRYVNTNKFSLSSMYRDRLIAVFLGASNPLRRTRVAQYEPHDNLNMRDLPRRPLQILNFTAFLASRNTIVAEPFTASALHAGSHDLGYRPAADYAGPISLGTAMAISGAASSANVGHSSSWLVRFILNLLNARLGWWLPNPGLAGEKVWHRRSPTTALSAFWNDILARGTDSSPWVHLGDGGHVDSLGIYQMVLRRCGLIIAVDASQDQEYRLEELAATFRRIESDLGIPVDFPEGTPSRIAGAPPPHMVGRIRYSAVDLAAPDGVLLYLKPVPSAGEPVGIRAYASAHPEFPHQILEGKNVVEAQFEAYRLLGRHAVEDAIGAEPPEVLGDDIRTRLHSRERRAAAP